MDHTFRHEVGRVVAALTRMLGVARLDLAEDAAQDALLAALRSWPYRGVPENPGAWLMRVGRNRALDLLRREAGARGAAEALARAVTAGAAGDHSAAALDSSIEDDQLRMMFACCHPALPPRARVALTLKTLGGLGVPEIARAFLTSEATVGQRLVRAKRSLKRDGVRFEIPDADELPARLDSVLGVLYLLFNEGYAASAGDDLVRHELCAEAIRLVSLLAEHPAGDRPPVHALRALMLLQAARLPARTDRDGALVLLEEQDRGLWDRRMIALGLAAFDRSIGGNALTAYHLEAAIAAAHAVAPSHAETDWKHILDQYDSLARQTESPVVALNRAVALAMVEGPDAGIAELSRVRRLPGMEQFHLMHAALGALHARRGDHDTAAGCYRSALSLAANGPAQRFLARRAAECEALSAGVTAAVDQPAV